MRRRNYENRNENLVSNCGSLRLRGTAQQISQKYTILASETEDRMMIETYMQHAEHYNRIGTQ
jgi:hypothetical protein